LPAWHPSGSTRSAHAGHHGRVEARETTVGTFKVTADATLYQDGFAGIGRLGNRSCAYGIQGRGLLGNRCAGAQRESNGQVGGPLGVGERLFQRLEAEHPHLDRDRARAGVFEREGAVLVADCGNGLVANPRGDDRAGHRASLGANDAVKRLGGYPY
jgi:hypothetical protein